MFDTSTRADLSLDDLGVRYERDVPLGPLTWYGVGGKVQILAHPASIAQLGTLVVRCREAGVPLRVLGSGANLLVSDAGVPGVVVRLDDPGFSQMRLSGDTAIVGAGYDLFKLVRELARQGLGGLEVVAGIPASVGGAVRMNAGGAFGDIGASVSRVQVMSIGGQVYHRDRDDLQFSYRKSNIAAPLILEVEFALTRDDPEALMRRVKEIFFYKKSSQPMAASSAGCAFKNPGSPTFSRETPPERSAAGEPEDTEDPSLQPLASSPCPSAGALIDHAGLKGFRIGGASVSEVHANFIVADRGATAGDIQRVLDHVQQEVHHRTGILLEREVVVWP